MPALHRQHRLDETRDAGRRVQMSETGLDGADQQRNALGTCATEHRSQRAGFDRVAKQRAGGVGLDVVDLASAARRR